MTLPVVFRRRVGSDLVAAFDWYEAQKAELGQAFLSATVSAFKCIELYPDMFAFVHGNVRRAHVPRYPFSIFYLVEPKRIVILRVLHSARNPNLWPRLDRKTR
ncbi:MAG: type II toxin-antitoxin system RelE/ParE family toxin [Burkholderiales bacterium]|nr:type II toxin-antitoxin system RelE/ParE family toxin [Burkholderiales bacterium]